MNQLIKARGLKKTFRNRSVVKSIDLDVHEGEILALIGSNGAGKTTTIALLLGMMMPDEGTIIPWIKDYQHHVGVQLQTTPFFEGYTVEENLKLFAALYNRRLSKEDIAQKLDECGLTDSIKTPAVRLSLGQQKRLSLAITTIHNPKLVVLDEPSAGLDPMARHDIKKMMSQLAKNNVTVLFSSHDMDEVMEVAHRLIFMHNGTVIAYGKIDELLTDHNVDNLDALYIKLTQQATEGE
ncbi:ABC transporter ATP-binding protein [Bacillus sp. A301a_S52]|nr:ABC transporter ATP-binding protein [Bacillus sp. A301a_S52]